MSIIHRIKEGNLLPAQDSFLLRAKDYQAILRAQDIVAEARKQADGIVAEAQKIHEEAHGAGYREGLKKAEFEKVQRSFQMVGRALAYAMLLENRLVDIVAGAVKKILTSFEAQDYIAETVKEAMGRYRNLPDITVYLAVKDYAGVEKKLKEMAALEADFPAVRLEKDEHLSAGACLIKSPLGSVDLSLGRKAEQLVALFEEMKQPEHSTGLDQEKNEKNEKESRDV